MANEEWYRNRSWNDDIEAAFNGRLERSRSQKAQYLRIQGSILKDSHPDIAIHLLKRCVDMGDELQLARALLDIAHAELVRGDVDAALDTLEALIDQEERQPGVRTTAAYDYPFLVAVNGRTQRYERALDQLGRHGDGFFESMIFEAETARALIFDEQGNSALAKEAARRALDAASVAVGWVPGHPAVGLVPRGPHPLFGRLRRIAEAT